jgi:transcriptional regulator with XRE-family HTH domain
MSKRTLGSEIQSIRKMRGLSLQAVAQPAGLSATYLQKLERDEVDSPSPHRLHSIAEVLGVDYGALFELAGYPMPGATRAEGPRRTRRSSAPHAVDLATSKGSLLRNAFQSEEQVTDEELEQLARYLSFLRQQREGR